MSINCVSQQGRRLRSFVLAFASVSALSACTVTQQQALEPLDWVDAEIERYPVTGTGSWARLRKQPLTMGPYTADIAAQSIWSSLPTTSTTGTQVAIGSDDERGKQLRSGTVTQHNESELQFTLRDINSSLAQVRCRQLLHIEDDEVSYGRNDGSDRFSMSETVAYDARLECKAKSLVKQWPSVWELTMHSAEAIPLRGTLQVDNTSFAVVGTQASTIGHAPHTVSYEIKRGERTLALVDRSGDGTVSLMMPAGELHHHAFVGAAAVLLLSNDPLQP